MCCVGVGVCVVFVSVCVLSWVVRCEVFVFAFVIVLGLCGARVVIVVCLRCVCCVCCRL